MTAHELEVIHADLLIAKNILYPTDGGRSLNNPQLVNLAAYLSAQAIEKSLKAIVRDGGDMNAELEYTHNVASLLVSAEMCKPNFVREHQFIAKNAKNLTKANGLRYGKKRIERDDTIAIYKASRKLYNELQAEYLKDNPDEQRLFSAAEREHKAMEKIPFEQEGRKNSRKVHTKCSTRDI